MMFRTVYIDRGDHYEILACYEGARRHKTLTAGQWATEYSSHDAYASMRQSHPGSVAGITPQRVGRWSKDWQTRYDGGKSSFQMLPQSGEKDFDGASVARGSSVHEVLVKPSGTGPATGTARIMVSAPVPVSSYEIPVVQDGVVISVGPVPHPCDVVLVVADPSGIRRPARIRLRFL